MPRTKRPVKKTEKASESGEASEFLKKLNKAGMFLVNPFSPQELSLFKPSPGHIFHIDDLGSCHTQDLRTTSAPL